MWPKEQRLEAMEVCGGGPEVVGGQILLREALRGEHQSRQHSHASVDPDQDLPRSRGDHHHHPNCHTVDQNHQVNIYSPCSFMGISEPVLEEEGSLIAGWRAKFGEENHQVIATINITIIVTTR